MFSSRPGGRNLLLFIRRNLSPSSSSSRSRSTATVGDLNLNRSIRSHLSSSSSVSCSLVTTELVSRALVRLTGPDTFPFLQGLITNDISHVEGPDGGPLFALLLNHQGRVLYDVIIYSRPEETLLECDLSVQPQLLKHLTLYRVKKKVVIADATPDLSPWVVFKLITDAAEVDARDKKKDLVLGDHRGISDPRLCELGWRFYVPKGQTLDTSTPTLTSVSPEEYKKLRYSLGVGEGVKDIPVGNSFPLESNGDYLHGVSFHKGCYVGQELTARTHHTGVIRKRLMPFVLPTGTQNFPSDTDTSKLEIKTQGGKSVGKVRDIIGEHGLALTRVEEALSGKEALKIGDLPVSVKKPNWWPIELPKTL